MEWVDQGIILGTRRHGESSVIAELMTRAHGRHLGLVRGGRSSKMQPLLQTGNAVDVVWRARLDEHLGEYKLEPEAFHAARLMDSELALNGLQLASAHLRLLPERDPHPALFDALLAIIEHLENSRLAAELVARFELKLLDELGFGLDLSECAATGETHELVYVSPKSGRAVSRAAGAQWADRLLPLPAFLEDRAGCGCDALEAELALRLCGYFLDRDVWQPRGMEPPLARTAFLNVLQRPGVA
jgi:DNA repair protein RecO (recombination protein O)